MHPGGRLAIVLVVALGAAVLASAAAADAPERSEFSNIAFSSTLSDVCAFDVTVDSVVSGFEIDYFDEAGNITRAEVHQVERDTFSANGKTLVGIPFAFNLAFRLDENGDLVSAVARGVAEMVPLPDGSVFVSAGWLDFVDHPGAQFVLSPDRGNPGNVAGFCAALAP